MQNLVGQYKFPKIAPKVCNLASALGRKHDITMINMLDRFLYVPSLVWVGVGRMNPEKTRFPLKPVYDRMHVNFVHGKATAIHPDDQYVVVENRDNGASPAQVPYDYLVIATGPQLDFAATAGLGPERGHTYSICTVGHAVQARDRYLEAVERMKRGEKQKLVIGIGHGTATCEGAAFEYISNVHKDLIRRGVRDKAELLYLTNEPALGDFGVRGLQVKRGGQLISSEDFLKGVFKEYNLKAEVHKAVKQVEPGQLYWEDGAGGAGETPYDFAMLLPRFQGMPFKSYVCKQTSHRVASPLPTVLLKSYGFILIPV